MHPDLERFAAEADPPVVVDLAAKWKHGWIPLNAEAQAILDAKAKHGEDHIPHAAMLAMPLADLKEHYSKTIKTHGFQHDYTKKVGKAVGSHPESLAKTKATKEAKKATGAAAPSASPAAPVAPASIQPKTGPTVADVSAPVLVKPLTGEAAVKAAHPAGTKIEPVKSFEGVHIGYVAHHTPEGNDKKYTVHNLDGTKVSHVNSFTGAQHALGETKLGKKPDPWKVGGKVTDPAHLDQAPDGTTMTWTNPGGDITHTYVKTDGVWLGDNPMGSGLIEYKQMHFKTALEKNQMSWGGTAPKPTPEHLKNGAKVSGAQAWDKAPEGAVAKYTSPGGGTEYWMVKHDGAVQMFNVKPSKLNGEAVGPEAVLDPKVAKAPITLGHKDGLESLDQTAEQTHWTGQVLDLKAEQAKIDTAKAKGKVDDSKLPEDYASIQAGTNHHEIYQGEDGNLVGYVKGTGPSTYTAHGYNGNEDAFHPIGTYPNATEAAKAVATYHTHDGEMPEEDKSKPKYVLAQAPGIGPGDTGWWGVKNTHTGEFVPNTQTKGKPNASKKANDLNKAEGYAHNGKVGTGTTGYTGPSATPAEMGHPDLPKGVPYEEQLKHTFAPDKAGLLPVEPDSGGAESDALLKFSDQSNVQNKRDTTRKIDDWMTRHYGFDDPAKVAEAYKTYSKIQPMGGISGEVPQSFSGSPDDPYSALPRKDNLGEHKLGTPEYNAIMRRKMIANMVQLWASSSNDDHAVSLSLQNKAAEVFKIPDYYKWTGGSAHSQQQMADLEANPVWNDLASSFLRAQYDATQARFKADGITHVTIRRGTKGGIASNVPVGGTANCLMRPLSSWTTNHNIAQNFAGGKYVLQARVPVEKVIGFAGNGFGCTGEYELVVIGGNTRTKLVARGQNKSSDYYHGNKPLPS